MYAVQIFNYQFSFDHKYLISYFTTLVQNSVYFQEKQTLTSQSGSSGNIPFLPG